MLENICGEEQRRKIGNTRPDLLTWRCLAAKGNEVLTEEEGLNACET